MQIRRIEIKTVDGLSPIPVSSAWVRDGLFVIGMDSEFGVYTQWRALESPAAEEVDTVDHRHLQDAHLLKGGRSGGSDNQPTRSLRSHESFSSFAQNMGGGTKPLADIEKRKKGKCRPSLNVDICKILRVRG